MKKQSVFAGVTGFYTIRSNDGRVATVFANSRFDAMMRASRLWADAREVSAEKAF